MKFNRIREAIEQASAERIRKNNEYIDGLTAGKVLSNWYAANYLTPKTAEALKACDPNKPIPAGISEKMKAKAARIETSLMNKRLDKVAAAEAVELPEGVTINIEWKKSRTWGANPLATVYADFTVSKGQASGAGYDKQSTSIANAFNKNPEVMAIIYTAVEAEIKPGYSVSNSDGLPLFDGGCGVECFYKVFKNCGYQFRKTASGKFFDCYLIERMPEVTRTWRIYSPDNAEKMLFDWTKFKEFNPDKEAAKMEIIPEKDGFILVSITAKNPLLCLYCLIGQDNDGLGECHTFNIIEEVKK